MTNPYGGYQPDMPPPPRGPGQGSNAGQFAPQQGGHPPHPLQQAHPGQPHPTQQPVHHYPMPQGTPAGYSTGPGGWGPPPRPLPVWIASVLAMLIALSGIILGVLLMAMQDGFFSAFQAVYDLTGLFQAGLSAMLTFAGACMLAAGIVLLVISIFAFRGHNWARWTLCIWMIASVLTSLSSLAFWLEAAPVFGIPGGLQIFSVVSLAMMVALLVLYLLPVSGRWYRQQNAAT